MLLPISFQVLVYNGFFEFLVSMSGVLFEDIFEVKEVDPGGKKFDLGVFMITDHWSAK